MSEGAIQQRIDLPVPADGADMVRYAAAFLHPDVRAVETNADGWRFTLAAPVDGALLAAGLERLIARFAVAMPVASAPLFSLAPREDRDRRHLARLRAEGAIQEIHPGLLVLRAPLASLLRFLDWAVLARFARPFAAAEEAYPNCIPLASLGRTLHLSSFPEHLHFLTHLTQDLDLLDGFAQRARDESAPVPPREALSPVALVHNPSTCYHCYAARANSDLAEDVAVTAVSRCHRFEAANHSDLGRLLEFTLREVIFVGAPDYVAACRERTLALLERWARDWELAGELGAATDPFFTSDFEVKAGHQQRLAMKYEFRMQLPGERRRLAVASSNLHGPTFGKSFGLRRGRRPLHSGCLGFGHERLVLAIAAQHGTDPSGWPAGLARDYARWAAHDALMAEGA